MDDQSFFNRPVVRAVIIFVLMVVAYFILGAMPAFIPALAGTRPPSPVEQYISGFWDVVLCGAGLFFWLAFFSQFILPLTKISQRLSALSRMVIYFLGSHGPAIFIENGIVREQHGERGRRGPGVLWLDSASAAMLRTATRFTRTVGPGIHFTSRKEYIAATADLHRLSYPLGLFDNDEPFTTHKDDPDVQKRFWETRAMTRDGIEVGAGFSITFRINPNPSESLSRFGFNAENARRAITHAITQGVPLDQPVWSPLPAKMTIDLWREYISRFRLNELFEVVEGKNQTALQMIVPLVRQRLTSKEVEGLDDFGKPTGLSPESPEYKLLQEMGLEVIGFTFKRVVFRPEVEEKLVSHWTSLWLRNAQYEREQLDKIRRLAETRSQEEAMFEYANMVSAEFQDGGILPRNKAEALYHLTHATARGVIRNPGLMKRLSKADTRILTELANWLEDKQ